MIVHLSGKMPKGEELKIDDDWRHAIIMLAADRYRDFVFTRPDQTLDLSDPLVNVGFNAYLIKQADVMIVSAVPKIGVGTAQEMMIAKRFAKPVVTILPRDTHHRRANVQTPYGHILEYIHPFIVATSDAVVETSEQALAWINHWSHHPATYKIKTMDVVDQAIAAFQESTAFNNLATVNA